MRFLVYYLDNFEPRHIIDCLVFNNDEFTVESDFDKFINYNGHLQKVIFIEEYSLGRATDIWHHNSLIGQHNITWIANFGGGSPVDVYRKFKRVLDLNKVNYDKVNILTNSSYEFETLDKVFSDKKPNYVAVHYCDMIALRELIQAQKPKRFTFFSRNWNPYRLLSFIDLMERRVLANSYFSFFNIKNVYKDQYEPYHYYNLHEISNDFYHALNGTNNHEWKQRLTDYWETNKTHIFRKMPYTLHGEKTETGEPDGWQVMSSTFRNAFENSHFSLVPETYMGTSQEIFQCTEKTVKAVIHRHPFMVYSNKDFLKRMKTYGFKSFGEYIDESYDDILNPVDKIYAINTQAEKLNNMHYIEFKKLMWDMVDITTHNYQVIMERIKNPASRVQQLKYSKEVDAILMKSIPIGWYHNNYGNN